jgi:DNA invertase Pin-like site-specific DNA recombinase
VTEPHDGVRTGYARVSGRAQDHQAQLDALADAHCRLVVIETANARGPRPKLRATIGGMHRGDTLVIHNPGRIAGSVRELLVVLGDELFARGLNLEILAGSCAGLHRPDVAIGAERMLYVLATMAAELESDVARERTLDGLRAAQAQGRRGGRPTVVTGDTLAVVRARQARGDSVTSIARHLGIGRSTLYRALEPAIAVQP